MKKPLESFSDLRISILEIFAEAQAWGHELVAEKCDGPVRKRWSRARPQRGAATRKRAKLRAAQDAAVERMIEARAIRNEQKGRIAA
jgi:hypothetical protein